MFLLICLIPLVVTQSLTKVQTPTNSNLILNCSTTSHASWLNHLPCHPKGTGGGWMTRDTLMYSLPSIRPSIYTQLVEGWGAWCSLPRRDQRGAGRQAVMGAWEDGVEDPEWADRSYPELRGPPTSGRFCRRGSVGGRTSYEAGYSLIK